MKNQTLFEDSRMSFDEAIELTIASLNTYRQRYDHWVFGYSGGKDSTATVTLIAHLIESGLIEPPKSLKVLYADTGMEMIPLNVAAHNLINNLRERGFDAEVVKPILDQRFFVYMFGRGVPPPTAAKFRWCTGTLKIEPMSRALESHAIRLGFGEMVRNVKREILHFEKTGLQQEFWKYQGFGQDKLLMITGVRLGESAARDERIVLSCSKDGSECGQGYLQQSAKEGLNDVLAPLVHWRVCHIWDWLKFFAPDLGFDTKMIADVYGIDEEDSTAESDARTGCIQCNVAKKDTAFDNILKIPYWQYLHPLKRLRPLYAELREAKNRHRKHGERNAQGELVKNQNRLGPLTFEARYYGLDQVLQIQNEINMSALTLGRPLVSLISDEELKRIYELIQAKTFPDKWTGDEMRGDEVTERTYADGTIQPWMFEEETFQLTN
jgi:DNA sulfur modification protein DndC